MVGGGDHDCLGLLILDEVEHAAEGLVVGKHLVDLGSGIVVVAGVVNTRTFNHEEETLVLTTGAEDVNGLEGHVLETGLIKSRLLVTSGGERLVQILALDVAVEPLGHVGGGEDTKSLVLIAGR